jgi:hypothetical protein
MIENWPLPNLVTQNPEGGDPARTSGDWMQRKVVAVEIVYATYSGRDAHALAYHGTQVGHVGKGVGYPTTITFSSPILLDLLRQQ